MDQIESDNIALINDFVETVWRRGRIDRLSDYWTDDCINHADRADANVGIPALRAYHEGFATAFAGFSEMDITTVQQIADRTRVVTHMATRLRHTGPFNGIAATGKTVTLESMRIDRIEKGKIAEHWSVGDLAGLLMQLSA